MTIEIFDRDLFFFDKITLKGYKVVGKIASNDCKRYFLQRGRSYYILCDDAERGVTIRKSYINRGKTTELYYNDLYAPIEDEIRVIEQKLHEKYRF